MVRIWSAILALLLAFGILPVQAQALQPRASIVSFGLWDAQKLFRLEAARGAAVLAKDFGAGPRVTIRANTPRHPDATPAALAEALRLTARGMDKERDVLFVLLTSHGSQDGIAVRIGRGVVLISPAALGAMLARTGVKHRVLIISACYSGVFANALADADTLVLTAADADHPSFGCTNTATSTYFGQALFNEALRQTRSLPQAFELAKVSIAKRERAQKFDPSNPQMRGGENVLPLLDALAGK